MSRVVYFAHEGNKDPARQATYDMPLTSLPRTIKDCHNELSRHIGLTTALLWCQRTVFTWWGLQIAAKTDTYDNCADCLACVIGFHTSTAVKVRNQLGNEPHTLDTLCDRCFLADFALAKRGRGGILAVVQGRRWLVVENKSSILWALVLALHYSAGSNCWKSARRQ